MLQSLDIVGPAGRIEAVEERPEGELRGVVVLCHPHPLYGGDMDDAVLTAVKTPLLAAGYACVRYNMRGVGASEGEFDSGQSEGGDVLAVAEEARKRHGEVPLYALGYSFGAYVLNRVLVPLRAEAVAYVAPPVGHMDFDIDSDAPCPVHVFVGDEDELAPLEIVREWSAHLPADSTLHVIEGADHVFTRGQDALAPGFVRLIDERG